MPSGPHSAFHAARQKTAADYECSSPDRSPTGRDERQSSFPAVVPTPMQLDISTEEFPSAAAAAQRLTEQRAALRETLEGHDREVMSREEALLALTREAKIWKQKTADLQAQIALLRKEKEEASRFAIDQIDSLRASHRRELEELRSEKVNAETQLQRLIIDFDETKQQLLSSRRQLKELEVLRDDMGSALASLQRKQTHADSEVRDFEQRRTVEQRTTQQKLESLRSKFDSLEKLCDTLRREKDAIEAQARNAAVDLHELRSKREHRVLVDAQELHDKEQQLLKVEEQLQAAHLNNCRLLRLMAECPELHDIIRFNEITQDFVFVGYHALTAAGGQEDLVAALELPPGAMEDDALKLATADARSSKHRTGGSFGVVGGCPTTKNAFLRGGTDGAPPPLSGVPHAMRHLHDAIREENHFLRKANLKLGEMPQPDAFNAASLPPSTNLLECKSHEKFYWIPRSVLMEAQEFKQAYFPKLALSIFFPFLVRLNHIWRQREQHMVGQARRSASTSRPKAAQSQNRCGVRLAYEQGNTRRMEDDLVHKELDALNREVRLRVSSRTAQQLCKQYDMLARLQVQKRAHIEHEYDHLATLHNHTLADRAPHTVAMQAHLRTLADTARSLSNHVAGKLCGASDDVRVFLASLEAATRRSAVMSAGGVVSATVLKQLMDCVKDFADEVRTEATVTQDSLRRISNAADHAATEVPPTGHCRADSSSDGPPSKRHHAHRSDPYSDLVDDVELERRRTSGYV